MRPLTYSLLPVLSLFSLLLLPLASAQEGGIIPLRQAGPSAAVPGRYIVLLKSDGVHQVTGRHGVARMAQRYDTLRGFAADLTPAQARKLAADPEVMVIQPDYIVEAFAKPSTVAKPKPTQTLPTGVNRIDADLSPTAQIDGTEQAMNADIAIIDTGVQKSHPDLNVYRQVNFTTERSADDANGHGTHVAGTAAARDNTAGVVGVAPGARIWSVKVLNRNGSGYLSDVIKGIDYVTANAAAIEVANMSLGCEGCQTPAMDEAIRRSVTAGVVYTVAAGNNAKDAATFSPANHPDVIAVSAMADFNGKPGGGAAATCRPDVDDTFADFSNYGAVVDIAAPGVCILSTTIGGKYATLSGTSMASPHVAGAAALYIIKNGMTKDAAGVAAVRAALIAGGTPQGDLNGFSGDPDAFAEPLVNAAAL